MDEGLVRTVPQWSEFRWLSAGFSRRLGGVTRGFAEVKEEGLLNLGFVPQDEESAVEENRRRLLLAVEGVGWQLVVAKQVHGVEVREVTAAKDGNASDRNATGRDAMAGDAMVGGRGQWVADGLVTDVPGVLLGVGAADCVPLLMADWRLRVVGAFHAGWRGTAAGMAGVGVARMGAIFGSRAADCVAAVGPSIGACCYEVGDEVREAFERHSDGRGLVTERDGRRRLDLWEANRRQLVEAGVPVTAITVLGECTACSRDEARRRQYFSHRAEKGLAGRMLGVIGVRRTVAG